jgi:hypothetical protein
MKGGVSELWAEGELQDPTSLAGGVGSPLATLNGCWIGGYIGGEGVSILDFGAVTKLGSFGSDLGPAGMSTGLLWKMGAVKGVLTWTSFWVPDDDESVLRETLRFNMATSKSSIGRAIVSDWPAQRARSASRSAGDKAGDVESVHEARGVAVLSHGGMSTFDEVDRSIVAQDSCKRDIVGSSPFQAVMNNQTSALKYIVTSLCCLSIVSCSHGFLQDVQYAVEAFT